jgi:phage-related protein
VDGVFKGLNASIDFFVKYGDVIVTTLGAMVAGVSAYVAYTTALKVMEGGWMALTVVQKLATAGQWALNAAMSANPIGLIVAGVMALVAGFIILWKRSKKFRNFWKKLWKEIKKFAMPVIKTIVTVFTTAWDLIQKAWSTAISFFKKIWNGIKKVFTGVVSYFNKLFTGAVNAIKTVVNGLISFFTGVWEAIKAVFVDVVSFYSGLFTNAVTAIRTAWATVTSFFSGIWTNIKTTFSNVKDWFAEKFGSAWTAIKEKFSGWATYWSGLWTQLKEKFKGMGEKIGKAMAGAVKGAMNKVISKIESVINKGIGFINKAIKLANKLPGVNVSTLKTIKLSRLAQGGVLKRGQVGVLEGSGAEAVVPLEKNTQWIRRVAESMRTEFGMAQRNDVSAPAVENFRYNQAVDAFKQALSEMQIVLDDETAGKFVERTVTRYIYA